MTLASSTALGWLVWRREKNKKLLLLKIDFFRRHVFYLVPLNLSSVKKCAILKMARKTKWRNMAM